MDRATHGSFGGSPCTPASKTTDHDHNVPPFEVVELGFAQLCAGDSQRAKQEVRLLPKD
jgi:hypothetical protein